MSEQLSISCAVDLYRKLERTVGRREAYGEYQLDWLFDVAITAWHLLDWLAEERGMKVSELRDRVVQECPALLVCRQICDGFKHVRLDNPRLVPFNVTRDIALTNERAGLALNVRPGDHIEIRLTRSVAITDRAGKRWESVELAWNALSFYRQELGVAKG